MTDQTYERERDVAVAAVREAACLCRAVQRGLAPDALRKKDRSPVTVADFGSQALVCRAVRAAFPEDPIIAEEDATALRGGDHADWRAQVVAHVQALRPDAREADVLDWIDQGNAQAYSDRFWTLDPIDGTKGFLRGDQYAVALALIVEGQVVVSALACPNLALADGTEGAIYSAVRGRGTVALAVDDARDPVPVRVSAVDDETQARLCESFESGHSAHDESAAVAERLGITAAPVRIDSQAKYALVARGDADVYLRLPTRPGYVEKIWDHAAGQLVVTEAGGTVTDVSGAPLSFRHGSRLETNRGVVVTNGRLHAVFVDALQAEGVQ